MLSLTLLYKITIFIVKVDLMKNFPSNEVQKTPYRWTQEQKRKFQRGLQIYGTNWIKIRQVLPQKTLQQIRSHSQKYFQKKGKKLRAKYDIRANQVLNIELKNMINQEDLINIDVNIRPTIQNTFLKQQQINKRHNQEQIIQENKGNKDFKISTSNLSSREYNEMIFKEDHVLQVIYANPFDRRQYQQKIQKLKRTSNFWAKMPKKFSQNRYQNSFLIEFFENYPQYGILYGFDFQLHKVNYNKQHFS